LRASPRKKFLARKPPEIYPPGLRETLKFSQIMGGKKLGNPFFTGRGNPKSPKKPLPVPEGPFGPFSWPYWGRFQR